MNKNVVINNMEDVRDNYVKGYYDFTEAMPAGKILKDDYIFDDTLSIRQNQEMIKQHNESVSKAKDEFWDKYYDSIEKFNSDFKIAIEKQLNVSKYKAHMIFNHIYNERHSGGYSDMINYALDFLDLLSKLL